MANPNISLLGATYSGVSGVTLPKSGGGTATFPWVEGSQEITENGTVDVTNLASVNVNVSGGGGSSYTLLVSKELTVSQTSTTATSKLDIALPNGRFTNAILYVRIRDKAGKRNGYFYGSDNFVVDIVKANGSGAQTFIPKVCYGISSSGSYSSTTSSNAYTTSGGYGVYVNTVNDSNGVRIYARYNSSLGTINGTFTIDVYSLKWPDNGSL